jgi:hypothetical protein
LEFAVEEFDAFLAAARFAWAAAFGPSAGSLPAAIWTASRPPITSVAMTERTTSFAVRVRVGWRAPWR